MANRQLKMMMNCYCSISNLWLKKNLSNAHSMVSSMNKQICNAKSPVLHIFQMLTQVACTLAKVVSRINPRLIGFPTLINKTLLMRIKCTTWLVKDHSIIGHLVNLMEHQQFSKLVQDNRLALEKWEDSNHSRLVEAQTIELEELQIPQAEEHARFLHTQFRAKIC